MSKTIRIGELPQIKGITNEDLIVINAPKDDRTYAITWEDMLGSIKEISQPKIVVFM